MRIPNPPKSIRVGFTNCYILDTNSGFLLIDTGYPQDYLKFKDSLKKKYKTHIRDIKFLLLTHHHDDHAGFAKQLLNDSGARLIVHEKALKRLSIGKSEEESIPVNKRVKFFFSFFKKFHDFVFPSFQPSEQDIILKGNGPFIGILKEMGIDGTILYTPGHTNDGISLVLNNGFIFPGDNAMNAWYFNVLGIKKRPIFVQDINLIYESWKQYLEYNGKIICPAHGKTFYISKLRKALRKQNN